MSEIKHRDTSIDILKAIGIILMVVGHSGFIYTRWIYQFHMALFFLASGYCYNEKNAASLNSLKTYVIGKVKSLYFPCLVFNTSIVLLHNVLYTLNITGGGYYSLKHIMVSLIKCVLFSGGESLSGAMWFLRTLFFASILYAVIDYISGKIKIIEKIKLKMIISVLCLIIGYFGYYLPGGKYFNIFSVVILLHMGYSIKKLSLLKKFDRNCVCVVGGIIGFAVVTIAFQFGDLSINLNRLVNPLHFIVCSLAGTTMCYSIAKLLSKTKCASCLAYIGKNTLPIVMYHFIFMKLVMLLQIVIYNYNISALQNHGYLDPSGGWFVLYSIVGLIGPLFFNYLIKELKNKKT